jgi:putative oxidoreductase
MSYEWNLIAKMLIGFFFVFFGVSNILQRKNIIELMQQKNIPFASLVFYLGCFTESVCGLLIMSNQFLEISASILIIFVITAVFIFHRFWTFEGELRRLNQIIFISNLSVVLGALILVANSHPFLFLIGFLP